MAYTNPRAYIEYVTVISRGLTREEENGKLIESFYFNDWDSVIKDHFCFYGGDLENIKISLTPDLKELKWEVSIPKESLMSQKEALEKSNIYSVKSIYEEGMSIDEISSHYSIEISQSNIIKTSMFLLSSKSFIENDPRYVFVNRFKKEENKIESNLKIIERRREMETKHNKAVSKEIKKHNLKQ